MEDTKDDGSASEPPIDLKLLSTRSRQVTPPPTTSDRFPSQVLSFTQNHKQSQLEITWIGSYANYILELYRGQICVWKGIGSLTHPTSNTHSIAIPHIFTGDPTWCFMRPVAVNPGVRYHLDRLKPGFLFDCFPVNLRAQKLRSRSQGDIETVEVSWRGASNKYLIQRALFTTEGALLGGDSRLACSAEIVDQARCDGSSTQLSMFRKMADGRKALLTTRKIRPDGTYTVLKVSLSFEEFPNQVACLVIPAHAVETPATAVLFEPRTTQFEPRQNSAELNVVNAPVGNPYPPPQFICPLAQRPQVHIPTAQPTTQ